MASPPSSDPQTRLQEVLGAIANPEQEMTAVEKAVALARALQKRGSQLQTPQERRQQAELEKVMQNEHDKATLTLMTDQAFRAKNSRRIANQLTHILDVQGIPRFFTTVDRAMLRGFQSFGGFLPGVAVPLVKGKMREETANVILPAEQELLAKHLSGRNKQGVRMNVNFLGEALLGEDDARGRLRSYLAALQMPEIEVISVKVSTLYSQLSALSRRSAVSILAERMELLYRAAAKERYIRADGTECPKFVYLDMEEFRDLAVTVDTFMETLSRPGLERVGAGIALQAYIPDSFAAQARINEWARRRVAGGGAPVTIRLVKGANMESERVEASIAGWPQAPFDQKLDTDANFKRMLHAALEPETIRAVRLGVASHNLFEVAYALILSAEGGVLDCVQFEMLEGMVNHQRRAVGELVGNLLLYAPATKKEQFVNAIGYLIRRLDENTGPENFLRHAFKLEVGGAEWNRLEATFIGSFERLKDPLIATRRTQDRRIPNPQVPGPVELGDFCNEPDTDFALEQNLLWAESIVRDWQARCDQHAEQIPVVVDGEDLIGERAIVESVDPSRPGVVVARYRRADAADIDRALDCARRDPGGWRSLAQDQRDQAMARVAEELRRGRGDLIGAAIAEAGKTIEEADPEVSEAIDFAVYYPAAARYFRALPGVEVDPLGVVVVVPPWNFPIAIPCGGIAAALAAGNTVILKPASDVVLVAYELCKCFWRAGISKQALQFVPCSGGSGGARLVASDKVDGVILTGGTETALRMLDAKPELNLFAETGGKNATIVTSMSDREQAVAHVLKSAFGHAGQKCSATSLLILEAEVYDDPTFKEVLVDAATSLRVGSAWDLESRMGPMIRPPSDDLERGLKDLEQGESWALMPRKKGGNPHMYSPGIKWGTRPGNYTHMTEFFGPVLAVMRADNLHHAINLVNQTGYGLTSGLESLDAREQEIWRESILAGNLYINRGTTGAIVVRQPFGGMGKSAFGPGIKAGGPNYVAQFMRFHDRGQSPPSEQSPSRPERFVQLLAALDKSGALSLEQRQAIEGAMDSYVHHYGEEFAIEHDSVRLIGQDNVRRYLPVPAVRIRVLPSDSLFEIVARISAGLIVGSHITVSQSPEAGQEILAHLDRATREWGGEIEFLVESDDELAVIVEKHQTERIRYARREQVPERIRRAVGDTGIYIADTPVLGHGRVELLWYLMEQSISTDYHRYGNLGERASESRRPLPTPQVGS